MDIYLKWRDEFLKNERAKTPKNPNQRIKINIWVDQMMDITKESVKTFNEGHSNSLSIENKFSYIIQYTQVDHNS